MDNPVYDEMPIKRTPRFLYLYYLKNRVGTHFDLRVYLIEQDDPFVPNKQFIEDLVDKADNGQLQVRGTQIAHLPWRRLAYLAFVLRDSEEKLEGVSFHLVYPDGDGGNHTFRNGKNISKPIDKQLSGMWCVNHRLNRGGNILGEHDSEIFQVKFQGLPEERTHNEVGSNTGP